MSLRSQRKSPEARTNISSRQATFSKITVLFLTKSPTTPKVKKHGSVEKSQTESQDTSTAGRRTIHVDGLLAQVFSRVPCSCEPLSLGLVQSISHKSW